ncbi:MAG: hypothetical protein AABX51_08870 [Nanoarchaeota archaeon]|mgnify:CR=1 FL=1
MITQGGTVLNEISYDDFEEDVLFEIEENKRKKKVKDDKELFKTSINKKRISKQEMDELFLY